MVHVRAVDPIPSFVLAIFLFPQECGAQTHGTWQIKAGPTYMRSGDPLGTGHGHHTGHSVDGMGYHAGVGFEPELRRIGVRAELLFDVRSSGYRFNDLAPAYGPAQRGSQVSQGERSMRTVQVELPVLLTLHAWPLLRVDAGFATAYLLHADERITEERADGRVDERKDRTSLLAQWEAAAVVGAEVDSGQRLSMGLRLWKGITNLEASTVATSSTSTAWQLSLAYALSDTRTNHSVD